MRFAGTQLSNFLGDTTDFTNIAGTAINGRSQERKAVMSGEADKAIASLNSTATILKAEHQAEAIKAGGMAQGQASMWSGIASGVSGLAGGIGSMGGGSSGGGSNFSMSNGTQFNPYNPTPGGLGGVTSYHGN